MMIHRKSLLVASLLAASAHVASAATYSLSGTITSSEASASYPVDSTFGIQFDYNPDLAGPDTNADQPDFGNYNGSISNASVHYLGQNYSINNYQVSTWHLYDDGYRNIPNNMYLAFSGYTSNEGFRMEYISLELQGALTSDSLPNDFSSVSAGSFSLRFNDGDSQIRGTVDSVQTVSSTSAVPEPSSQLALLALGSAGLLTRRRVTRKA